MKPIRPASILITDDESNIRMMLRTALESEGYEVREAANEREALESLKRQPPDLMVLDLNMPELDGMAVLEEMKKLIGVNRPRVVILTAYGSIPTAVKAVQLGASDFLEKPITPTNLRETVRSLLDEPEVDRVVVPPLLVDSYERVLDRIRKSLRLADVTGAETLLMKAADRQGHHSAEYFNLLGVLYETQHKWRLARKCYNKGIDADQNYEPAKVNLHRLMEVQKHGRTARSILLGDESGDVMYARLPDHPNAR